MDGGAMLARLKTRLGAGVTDTHAHRGDHTAVLTREALVPALAFCRDEPDLRFDLLADITAVDYLRYPGREDGPRFDVVYHLYSIPHRHRLRLRVPVELDDPVVQTATG